MARKRVSRPGNTAQGLHVHCATCDQLLRALLTGLPQSAANTCSDISCLLKTASQLGGEQETTQTSASRQEFLHGQTAMSKCKLRNIENSDIDTPQLTGLDRELPARGEQSCGLFQECSHGSVPEQGPFSRTIPRGPETHSSAEEEIQVISQGDLELPHYHFTVALFRVLSRARSLRSCFIDSTK